MDEQQRFTRTERPTIRSASRLVFPRFPHNILLFLLHPSLMDRSAGMASTLVPPRNAVSWAGFMDGFQREFLNLMSFGYLDDSDNAGVFATDSTRSPGPGGIANTAGETAANVAAGGKPAIREGVGAARGLGNVFTYVTSPWAVMCLFMVCFDFTALF